MTFQHAHYSWPQNPQRPSLSINTVLFISLREIDIFLTMRGKRKRERKQICILSPTTVCEMAWVSEEVKKVFLLTFEAAFPREKKEASSYLALKKLFLSHKICFPILLRHGSCFHLLIPAKINICVPN